MVSGSRTKCRPICEKYQSQIDGNTVEWSSEELACENYILVDRCYREFGKIFYDSNYAKNMIEVADNFGAVDIDAEVKKSIKPGKHLCKDLKEALQQVYDANGYNRTAKATDINDYYPNSSEPISSGSGKYINVN